MDLEPNLIYQSEEIRRKVSPTLGRKKKSELGQFFTPAEIAIFMAAKFDRPVEEIRLLDPGAGIGSLTAAFVNEFCLRKEGKKPKSIVVHLFELDTNLLEDLEQNMKFCMEECKLSGIEFSAKIINKDFIKSAVNLFNEDETDLPHDYFNCVILNPPYKKIRTDSAYKAVLENLNINVTNMYAAFLEISALALCGEGELVAITPRSFCNGPYFKKFRQSFLSMMNLQNIHLFESREDLFLEDEVLQENVIFYAIKNPDNKTNEVAITSSCAADYSDISTHVVPYDAVIRNTDPEMVIHLPVSSKDYETAKVIETLPAILKELGINVSTGKVVDFRVKEYLQIEFKDSCAPLIYPAHFEEMFVRWPVISFEKPQAILVNEITQKKQLVPRGYYVVVKRFSSKEEKRRITAAVYDPSIMKQEYVGFENHLNYFHDNGTGLKKELAFGLVAFLNSSLVDRYFRSFNGHTQVNATDLKLIRYPSRDTLEKLGVKMRNYISKEELNQERIDELVNYCLC